MSLEQLEQPKASKFIRTKFMKNREKKVTEDVSETKVKELGRMSTDEWDDLVQSAVTEIDGIFVADEETELMQVEDWVSMPKPIQHVMGTRGIPCGLIIMVQGKKDSGKTTFAIEALTSAQKEGGIAVLLDTENKFPIKRAAMMGLDVKRLIILPAVTIEEAFKKYQALINLIKTKKRYIDKKTGEVFSQKQYDALTPANKKACRDELVYASKKVVCVWDSLGATPSEAEMDEKVKDFSMAAAKIIKGYLRKTVRHIRDTKVAFVIINQVYANMNMFGKKTTSYGGSGPEYHSAAILEFTRMGQVRPKSGKAGEDFAGIKTQIECVKNHLAQPFKKVEVAIDHKGFVVDRDVEFAPAEIKEEINDDESDAPEVPRREKIKKIRKDKARA